MTECQYTEPIKSFSLNITPKPWSVVPVLSEGREALVKLDNELGLAWDDWDIDYYTDMFQKMGRNPTSVECFDISQSNSEHSRHWLFKGRIVIDGEEMEKSLFDLVQETLEPNSANSVIAFSDNSSAIRGYSGVDTLVASSAVTSSNMVKKSMDLDVLFTAETHNFPTGVAPFPGAETGTGGRIRDTHATGRGSLVVAGTCGYSVGNLHIPEYDLPWEDKEFVYPTALAKPLEIIVSASSGASDYGNKFGEPVINGFARSFGMRVPGSTERREYIKPIMFTGGLGQLYHMHIEKGKPEIGMVVVKLGGPAFRIGLGGGAASSMMQGANVSARDFAAVQRGDAEVEQKVNRVIRACCELGNENPIISIHDQGAGGNANVLKEIVDPLGAKINIRDILVADSTLSVLEIWTAEYQEADALLIRPEHEKLFSDICTRERCPVAFVGTVTGDGKIVLYDSSDDSTPVDLPLEQVLGKMPRKVFNSKRPNFASPSFALPEGATLESSLDRVLKLLGVGSKRFLTNKVDRSVTGLVAQQQSVGPLHIPLSDYGVIAQSHLGVTGAATSVGEQPIKGLLSPSAMARMTVGESLTNIMFVKLEGGLDYIKASGNWMWPAKLEGEAAIIYDTCSALREILLNLGVAVDGGKDSVSMAARAGDEVVKTPGTLVMSLYSAVPNIYKKVNPNITSAAEGSHLVYLDFGRGKYRIGASALTQVYSQLGDVSPDLDDPAAFAKSWNAVQTLVEKRLIEAGHDRSDGGLIVTLLEMAFSGNCGFEIRLPEVAGVSPLHVLFSEELGAVVEVLPENLEAVTALLKENDVHHFVLGKTKVEPSIVILNSDGSTLLSVSTPKLRDTWEATSFQLEKRQANITCVKQEEEGLKKRKIPSYVVSWDWDPLSHKILNAELNRPKVAIIREEGSNGDREMASAFFLAGFQPWDVHMSDLTKGSVSLSSFSGVAFVGGFSNADVLDSAKGWAGAIRFNPGLLAEFSAFYNRKDTFSLGICNGCQLMALLGWVPYNEGEEKPSDVQQPRFIHNNSDRFESRFVSVKILPSPAVMLKGMEGSVLGVWSSHGEGKAHFPDEKILTRTLNDKLAPVRYVNDDNEITEEYPFNPNGSVQGIASLCSKDGRHLCMMPHPDRSFLNWQLPWTPKEWKKKEHEDAKEILASPWFKMFENARVWVESKK
eukprot:TRINITY_DN675_c0_g1_i1.p1 TRINITY_DN675_c0_g1~~TRINITY_DN675_c0_g1_i1.p1  ORF type:complete len:1177 (-),score=273.79 TRINITY_DN675_c0_g1_i1:121-3651(-)